MRGLLALLAACSLSGCLTGEWTRWKAFEEPPDSLSELHPGEATLTRCLDVLGAPLVVQEHTGGAVLAWGWSRERRWGATLSVPLGSESGSITYQNTARGLDGLVLFFDASWNLTGIRRGELSDVLPDATRRVQVVED